MPDIICEDPDHASRSAVISLGTSSVPGATMLCSVCAEARANDVVNVRARAVEEAKHAVSTHIESSFSAGAQQSLLALYSEAVATGKTNRKVYIQAALDWIQVVLTSYANYRATVESAIDADAVRLLTLDLDSNPPDVTVTAAILILD